MDYPNYHHQQSYEHPNYNYRDHIKRISESFKACRSKKYFSCFVAAEHYISMFLKEKPNVYLRSYKCQYCVGWHTTSKKEYNNNTNCSNNSNS